MRTFWNLGKKGLFLGAVGGLCLLIAGAVPCRAEEVTVDPAAQPYEKVSGVDGSLNSIGSDTMVNLMTLWGESFCKLYPNVKFQVEGKGSATAPPALTKGTAQLGPMSRKMKPEEEDAFEKVHGFRPTKVSVALDCLAVYVHKDNPLRGLTLTQADGIFSKTYKSNIHNITIWGQLNLINDWASMPIRLYGRNSASGTYAFFKEHVLLKGDYKDTIKEMPGSAAVVSAIAADRSGIGYSGIGYRMSGVRAIPLAKDGKSPLVEPTFENALNGTYPLGRTLYIYFAKKPNEPMPKLVEEFFKFVLSKDGQEIVIKDGYGPLPGKILEKQYDVMK
jgi:phosphate transport system substrate-binding protein